MGENGSSVPTRQRLTSHRGQRSRSGSTMAGSSLLRMAAILAFFALLSNFCVAASAPQKNEEEPSSFHNIFLNRLIPVSSSPSLSPKNLNSEGLLNDNISDEDLITLSDEDYLAYLRMSLLQKLKAHHQRKQALLQQQVLGHPKDKRGKRGGCVLHAGLAHNCDYRDVIGAVNEMSHWGSEFAPGKRRRR